jgi:HEAT repeat protein
MKTPRSPARGSKRAQRRAAVRALLLERDPEKLLAWIKAETNPAGVLSSLMFDADELVRWRAIETLGWVAADMAQTDLESVRDIIRRLLWSMNDESGNLVWNAPEAIGEVLFNVPQLIEEYAAILPSFLREEPFERGTHWAIARVAAKRPDQFGAAVHEFTASLQSADPYCRGLAALALASIGAGDALASAAHLTTDDSPLTLYDHATGQVTTTTVAAVARQAFSR